MDEFCWLLISFTPGKAIRVLFFAVAEIWLVTVMSLVMIITAELEELRADCKAEASETRVGDAFPPPVVPAP